MKVVGLKSVWRHAFSSNHHRSPSLSSFSSPLSLSLSSFPLSPVPFPYCPPNVPWLCSQQDYNPIPLSPVTACKPITWGICVCVCKQTSLTIRNVRTKLGFLNYFFVVIPTKMHNNLRQRTSPFFLSIMMKELFWNLQTRLSEGKN